MLQLLRPSQHGTVMWSLQLCVWVCPEAWGCRVPNSSGQPDEQDHTSEGQADAKYDEARQPKAPFAPTEEAKHVKGFDIGNKAIV